MKIEIWSDIACPFCYIGKQNLENALAKFPYKDQVDVEFKSFELDPNASLYDGTKYVENLASKFGGTEQAKQFITHLTQQAKNVGLTFNFDEMKPTNTFNAHRLAKWAKTQGKEASVNEKLLSAHFTESKDVGDLDTLADIAEASGLNRDEALNVLNDKKLYAQNVKDDQHEAKRYGINGVPYFIINQKYAVSGAQPAQAFSEALDKVWEEENPAPKLETLSTDTPDGGVCTDGSCVIPPKKS
ncbi:DsbA family oxidoreductase [Peribacillus frigoritolerans]|uniref:DsbA family oxidoreductase n=1 Tax=Peribacillus frigoritolerans TaxID=450367 RepID=UPI002226BF35|nr:DsbA family oxidoreductase [Peribacillus frigoritolerans]UYY96809.1 DsbA family oxidoreductase [Peribacillus frigoritolerans]